MRSLINLCKMGILFGMAAFTIGCTNAEKVEKLLNSDPNSGGKWDLVKDGSKVIGYSVFKGPDGKFYAFNTELYKKGMTAEEFKSLDKTYSGLEQFSKREQEWEAYTDENGFPLDRCSVGERGCGEYVWVTNYYYRDLNTGLVFEQGDTASKDLETLGSVLEEENLSSVKSALVSQFGLSETRASELASMASSVKNIADSQGRALTERDLESLQVKAMGASLADYKNAKAKGDTKAIEKMTAKAASLNKISSEQAKRLMKQLGL